MTMGLAVVLDILEAVAVQVEVEVDLVLVSFILQERALLVVYALILQLLSY